LLHACSHSDQLITAPPGPSASRPSLGLSMWSLYFFFSWFFFFSPLSGTPSCDPAVIQNPTLHSHRMNQLFINQSEIMGDFFLIYFFITYFPQLHFQCYPKSPPYPPPHFPTHSFPFFFGPGVPLYCGIYSLRVQWASLSSDGQHTLEKLVKISLLTYSTEPQQTALLLPLTVFSSLWMFGLPCLVRLSCVGVWS
jgi:hypothetical protein